MLSKAEEIGLILMIFVLMLGIGSSLTLADFKNAWRKPRGILIGMVSQFGLMPLIGFSLASLLGLPEWVGISLILVACTPGGTTSNLFTYFSRGDVSLSISMTVASSLAAIVMMPLLVGFYVGSLNSEIVVPAGKIIASVGIMLIPVSIGLLVRGKHPKTAAKLEKAGGLAGILIIALLIGSFVARESSRLAATPVHVYLAVLGICTG